MISIEIGYLCLCIFLSVCTVDGQVGILTAIVPLVAAVLQVRRCRGDEIVTWSQ